MVAASNDSDPAVLPVKFRFRSVATAAELSVVPVVRNTSFVDDAASYPTAVLLPTTARVVVATVVFVAAGIIPVASTATLFQLVAYPDHAVNVCV